MSGSGSVLGGAISRPGDRDRVTTGIGVLDRSLDAAADRVLAELVQRITAGDEVFVAASRWHDAKLAVHRHDRDDSAAAPVSLIEAEATALADLWATVSRARGEASAVAPGAAGSPPS